MYPWVPFYVVVSLCLVFVSVPYVDGLGLDLYAGNDPGDYIKSKPWMRHPEPGLELKLTPTQTPTEGKGHALTLRESVPSLLMAILAGLATVLGAFIVFLMPQGPPPKAMAFALSLAAGVMVAVASELVWGKKQGAWPYIFFVIGLVGTWLLVKIATYLENKTKEAPEKVSNPQDDMDDVAETNQDTGATAEDVSNAHVWRLAVVLFIALTLHNFPEGMAVAVSGLKSKQLGLTICIGIAFHNIPEGITIAITTYEATGSKCKALLMTLLSGIAEPLGALSAIIIFRSALTPNVVDCLVAIVAGVMLYISIFELLPEAYSKHRHFWLAFGFVSGVVIIVITALVLDHSIGE